MTKLPKNNSPILSVIILNYNAGKYLENLYSSLCRSQLTQKIEVILADNASTDNSFTLVKNKHFSHPWINFIFRDNHFNRGFSWGNNQGLKSTDPNSKYILFLNPDTTVDPDTLQGMINYFSKNKQIDAATCYVKLALTGQLQPECHRGFPTPWNAFSYFFLPFLPNSYIQNKDFTRLQEIDCCVGAFFMMKREVGESVGWWNEKYFFYGEDLDFCYKIKQHGYKLFFVPDYKITHYQGVSSGIKKQKTPVSRATKIRSALASTTAMKIFYQENLIHHYPPFFRPLIYIGINLLKLYRVFRAKYL